MTIIQNCKYSKCQVEASINLSFNPIPNFWYHKLSEKNNKLDCIVSAILLERLFMNQSTGAAEFQDDKSIDRIYADSIDDSTLWGEVRRNAVIASDRFTDIYFLSSVIATEDNCTKLLKLITSTKFVRSWIKDKYLSLLQDICKQCGYQVVVVG